MKRCIRLGVATLAMTLWSPALWAQWGPHASPRVPHTAAGEPDLEAAAPRTADGKPDLTGVWQGVGGLGANNQPALVFSKGPPVAGFLNIAQNIEGGLPFKPRSRGPVQGAPGRERQGQSRSRVSADGHHAISHAGRTAQDHSDARRARDPVRGQHGHPADLHRRPRSCRPTIRSRGGTAIRSGIGTATRSSSRRAGCATTAGSTSSARR